MKKNPPQFNGEDANQFKGQNQSRENDGVYEREAKIPFYIHFCISYDISEVIRLNETSNNRNNYYLCVNLMKRSLATFQFYNCKYFCGKTGEWCIPDLHDDMFERCLFIPTNEQAVITTLTTIGVFFFNV